MTFYYLSLCALLPHTTCTMMVGIYPYTPLLILGGNNYPPPLTLNISHELKRLELVKVIGSFFVKVSSSYIHI
jgi:hypothetical protein